MTDTPTPAAVPITPRLATGSNPLTERDKSREATPPTDQPEGIEPQ